MLRPRLLYKLSSMLLILGFIALIHNPREAPKDHEQSISCYNPYIIDGDTLDCNGHRIRLTSIDAPEISECRPGRKCVSGDPYAAKRYLQSISNSLVTCTPITKDHYGRTVARCEAQGIDLSCAMVKADHAAERYGSLSC